MAKLHHCALIALFIILLLLSLCKFSPQLQTARADSPALVITNIQTLNSQDQSCFYFCRGLNVTVFDVSVENNESSAASGQLAITMIDNCRVPIEDFQSQVFSVNPGQTKTVLAISNMIPNYAFVGIASAQVILENPSSEAIGFGNINYYIGDTIPPTYVFSGMTITSSFSSVTAGNSVNYTADAYDSSGDRLDISFGAVWSINAQAGGSWSQNVYTAAKAGVWAVTASLGGYSATASLTVYHAAADNIALSPQKASITAGQSEAFDATANDAYGNSWDVTNTTTFSISSNAGGYWSGNTYTAATAGTWIVSGSTLGFTGTASLTVNHGSPVKIVVASSPSSVTGGCAVIFTATANDAYSNSWNVTSQASWSIGSGAGGSWSGSTYTSADMGSWTVTASYMNVQGDAELTVYYPIDFFHEGAVNFNDVVYFVAAYTNFYEFGMLNPACDLNHDGTLNFLDITLFVAYYIAYFSTTE